MSEKLSFDPLHAGSLTVRLAQDELEVRASQQLRYRIFFGEMGGVPPENVEKQQRDFDQFDGVCDHLLVIDTNRTGDDAVVGTYRLLRKSQMEKIGSYYSETEYDITPLKALEGELLELGRSCVDADYRNRAVMQLLWRGIGSYMVLHDIRLLFGCASFTGDDPKEHAMALSYLYHAHLAPEEVRMTALPELYVDMNMMPKEEVDTRRAIAAMPPLIKGYLRLNSVVGDGAVLDHVCNTTDVSIVVQTDLVKDKYAQRYKPEE